MASRPNLIFARESKPFTKKLTKTPLQRRQSADNQKGFLARTKVILHKNSHFQSAFGVVLLITQYSLSLCKTKLLGAIAVIFSARKICKFSSFEIHWCMYLPAPLFVYLWARFEPSEHILVLRLLMPCNSLLIAIKRNPEPWQILFLHYAFTQSADWKFMKPCSSCLRNFLG